MARNVSQLTFSLPFCVAGAVIEKNGKILLVKETKKQKKLLKINGIIQLAGLN